MNFPKHSAQKSKSSCPSACFCSSVLRHTRDQLQLELEEEKEGERSKDVHSIFRLCDLKLAISFQLDMADPQIRSSQIDCCQSIHPHQNQNQLTNPMFKETSSLKEFDSLDSPS